MLCVTHDTHAEILIAFQRPTCPWAGLTHLKLVALPQIFPRGFSLLPSFPLLRLLWCQVGSSLVLITILVPASRVWTFGLRHYLGSQGQLGFSRCPRVYTRCIPPLGSLVRGCPRTVCILRFLGSNGEPRCYPTNNTHSLKKTIGKPPWRYGQG